MLNLGESKEYEVTLFKRGLLIVYPIGLYFAYNELHLWYYGFTPWLTNTQIPRYTLEGFQAILPYIEAVSFLSVWVFMPIAYFIANQRNTQALLLIWIILIHTALNAEVGFAHLYGQVPRDHSGFFLLRNLLVYPFFLFLAFTPIFAVLTRKIWIPLLHMCLSLISLWRYFFPLFAFKAETIESSFTKVAASNFDLIWEQPLIGFAINVGMLVVITVSVIFFVRYINRLNVDHEKQAAALSRYFSPAISQEIAAGRLGSNLDDHEERPLAILFTDIVGFTKMSEKLNPSKTLTLLSQYQSIMVDCIFRHNGTVDKFIGDAVMANFGTPVSSPTDAQNAFLCALEMNQRLAEWNQEREAGGLDAVQHRIGIHFGHCAVGNIGHEKRTEYAVIGDAVNVASRLCDACKELDTNFVVSRQLLDETDLDVHGILVTDFALRGRAERLDVYKIDAQ